MDEPFASRSMLIDKLDGRGPSPCFGLQGVSVGLLSALPLRRCGGFKMAEALTAQEQLVRVTLRVSPPSVFLQSPARFTENTSLSRHRCHSAIYPHRLSSGRSLTGGVMCWTRQLLARSSAPSPSLL